MQDALPEEPRRARLSYLIRQKAERDIAAAGKASAREMLCSHPASRLVLTAQSEIIPRRERDLPGNPSSLQERMRGLKGSTCKCIQSSIGIGRLCPGRAGCKTNLDFNCAFYFLNFFFLLNTHFLFLKQPGKGCKWFLHSSVLILSCAC